MDKEDSVIENKLESRLILKPLFLQLGPSPNSKTLKWAFRWCQVHKPTYYVGNREARADNDTIMICSYCLHRTVITCEHKFTR